MRDGEILLVGRIGDDVASACAHVASAGEAIAYLSAAEVSPALVVLSQARPGEFLSNEIEAIRRAAPLARIERVAGSWCEGERRSGHPPTGCVTHYWHQWPMRLARELTRVRSGNCPAWGWPPTMGADERLLAAAREPVRRVAGPIAICSRTSANAHALADTCRVAGYSPQLVREDGDWHGSNVHAVLWDTTSDRMSDSEAIGRIASRTNQAPLVAVVGFPRDQDCQAAIDAGVAAIISKPYAIRDLLAELARVIAD